MGQFVVKHNAAAMTGALLVAGLLHICRASAGTSQEWVELLRQDFPANAENWRMHDEETDARLVVADASLKFLFGAMPEKLSLDELADMADGDMPKGKGISRPIELPGDFDMEMRLRWSLEGGYGIFIFLHPNVSYLRMHGSADFHICDVARESVGSLPYANQGKATVRIRRTRKLWEVTWNEKLLAKRESGSMRTVNSLKIAVLGVLENSAVKTARNGLPSGSFLAIDSVSVRVRGTGSPTLTPPAAGANLLGDGKFESVFESSPLEDGDDAALFDDPGNGLRGLKGWRTRIDGKVFQWVDGKAGHGKCLRVRPGNKAEPFVSRAFPVEQDTDYMVSCRVRTWGDMAALCAVRQIEHGKASTRPLCELSPAKDAWNWQQLQGVFRITDRSVSTVDIALYGKGSKGAALFDDVEVVRAPGAAALRQQIRDSINSLNKAMEPFPSLSQKIESAIDVMEFDLEEIRRTPAIPREDAAELAVEVATFKENYPAVLLELKNSSRQLMEEAVTLAAFLDRVSPETALETLNRLRSACDRSERFAEESMSAKETLKRKLEARRPASQAQESANNVQWAANRFHIYWFNHYGLEPPGVNEAIRYMEAMGASSLQEWGYRGEARHGKWEDYVADSRRKLDLVQRENMRMFIIPTDAFVGHPHPNYRLAADEVIARHMQAFGDHPAFGGFEFDEIHFGTCWCRICMPMFREYLKKRFSHEDLVKLGVIKAKPDAAQDKESLDLQIETILGKAATTDGATNVKTDGKVAEIDQIGGPAANERNANPALYTIRMEWRAQVFEESVRAVFDRARELRPDVLMHTLLSPANFADYTGRDWGGPFGAPLYRMAAISDIITIDPYWNGVAEEAYWCDLMRAHAKGRALLTVGTHYDARTPDSIERDLCIPFAHTDGMYIFDWVSCFKQPPYNLNAAFNELWCPAGKWDKVWSVAMKARKIAPYLVRTESPRLLAMLHSMRSQALEQHKGDLAGADPGPSALALPGLYNMRQMGLYVLFLQARTQPDPVYAEGLTAEHLSRYRVLYVQNAVSMTPDEEEMIRSWVRSGGHLVVTASTTIMDRWGRNRKDYGLADVFGVSYAGTKTFDKVRLTAQPEMIYSGASDVVLPTSGKALLAWPDGSPAVVENRFGKGRCVFVTTRDLGLNYSGENAGPERRCFNVYKTYSQGVIEFVRWIVTRELAAVNLPLPYTARNVPGEVEVAVRLQPERNRRIVHLLNYGYHTPVKGVTVNVPAAGTAKAFYAADDRPIEFRRGENSIEFTVRDFDVHEAIVVEEPEQ